MRVIVCGGGTGGHIYPALSIAAELRRQGGELLYMGGRDSLEAKLAEKSGFAFFAVECCGLHKRSLKLAKELAVNYRGLRQARRRIRDFGPQLVIGTGGYAEAPVIRAAQGLGLPTLLHEQNAFPGLANRLLARKAQAVCLTFAEAGKYFPHPQRLHLTGLPVRAAILSASREQAYDYFEIPAAERERPTLLITGGSAGAASLNQVALRLYQPLLDSGARLIHLCGRNDYFRLRQQAPEHPRLILRPYLDEMENALALADLALARSGASFLAEAACLGLPTLLVPYPYAANDHQSFNAQAFADREAAEVVADSSLDDPALTERILALLHNQLRLQAMGEAARSLAHYRAAEDIAAIALGLVQAQGS